MDGLLRVARLFLQCGFQIEGGQRQGIVSFME